MALRAGQQAPKSEVIRCEACRDSVRVEKGDFIKSCATCGNNTFEPRKGGNKSSGKADRKSKKRMANRGMEPAPA